MTERYLDSGYDKAIKLYGAYVRYGQYEATPLPSSTKNYEKFERNKTGNA
jgi:hypothetical protein